MTSFWIVLFAGLFLPAVLQASSGLGIPVDGRVPLPAQRPIVSLPPDAQGNGVLFYCGNLGICTEGLSIITAFYESEGHSVTNTTTFPADLSPFGLIFLMLPQE
ncbi:MAG: hypothetical protein D6812_11960, partial [Deltaproteobacteria bacterium]